MRRNHGLRDHRAAGGKPQRCPEDILRLRFARLSLLVKILLSTSCAVTLLFGITEPRGCPATGTTAQTYGREMRVHFTTCQTGHRL